MRTRLNKSKRQVTDWGEETQVSTNAPYSINLADQKNDKIASWDSKYVWEKFQWQITL